MESSSSSSGLGSRSGAVPPRLAGRPSSLNPRYYPPLPSTPNSSSITPGGGGAVARNNQHGSSAFVFAPSPIATPSKRARASEWPFWALSFLKLLPLYTLLSWLQPESPSSSPSPSLLSFGFLALLASASVLVPSHHAWRGRPLLPVHLAALFGNGALLAASFTFRLQGLRSFGSLETILAEFAGALLGKTLFEYSIATKKKSDQARKTIGFIAILTSVFLLSQGWGKASCFPFAFDLRELRGLAKLRSVAAENRGDDCQRLPSVFAPALAGFFMVLQRNLSIRLPLRAIGKKRVQVLTYAFAAALMFPLAILESAMSTGQSSSSVLTQATVWPLVCFAAFGQVISYYADSYAEDKLLIPSHSSKEFVVISCSVCILELCYSSNISLAGFLVSITMLGIGARELSWVLSEWGGGRGHAWDNNTALGDSVEMEIEDTAKGLFRHIASDRRSKKIAIFLLMNSAFMLVEFFYGFLNNSLGLACDAFHMLFDCAALAIGLYASYISRLPASSQFNFGYGRFEVVSGYANAIFLVLGASLIVLESVERILEPPVISSDRLLAVSIGGLLVNLVGLVFFHEEHHRAHGGCSHSHEEESHGHSKEDIHNEEEVALLNVNPPPPPDHSFSFQSFRPDKDNNSMQQLSAWPPTKLLAAKEVKDIHDTGCTHRHDHAHHPVGHDHHNHHDHHHHTQTSESEATLNLTMRPINVLAESDFDSETGCNHGHDDHGHGHGHHHDHPSCDGHTPHHDHHDCKHSHHDHDDEKKKKHTHEHDHHHHMDHNMFGIFLHILADTLGSVGVVISTLLIKYKNWHVADPACSIFTAAMIIFSVIPLLKNSAEIMLQRVPGFVEQSLTRALTEVGQIPGVQNLQRFHAWSYSNQKLIGSLHLQVSAGIDKSRIRKMASKVLLDAGIVDLTLQVEEMKSGLAYMPNE